MGVSMNRIYQGRVTKVELLDQKKNEVLKECSKTDGEGILWDFHELFQDAVNYYLVCLMALAGDPENPVFKIRERVDRDDPDSNVWKPFRRNGQMRRGMREVARYFGLTPEASTFAECCSNAIDGNRSDPALLDLALQELLHYCSGDGKIQQEGRSMLPRFCNPEYKGSFSTGATADLRQYGAERLSSDFHALSTQAEFSRFADDFELGWVVNISQRGRVASGEKSRARLLKAVAHFGQFYGTHRSATKMDERISTFLRENPSCEQLLISIEKQINTMDEAQLPDIPPNAKSIADRVEACLLFKYFPSPELADLVKVSFPRKEQTAKPSGQFDCFGDDAIKLARGSRGYVFPAFSSSKEFGGSQAKPQWIEFDIMAFKEALKALHQIEQKGEERQKDRAQKQKRLSYMESGRGFKQAADDDSDLPPVLAGDPRIERLKAVLEELKRSSEMAAEDESEYGLNERTIRGFEKLAAKWMRVKVDQLSPDDAVSELKKRLTEFQVEEKNTMGSVELFEKLMRPENWIVWRNAFDHTPDEYLDQKFSRNPLEAYVIKLGLEEEISRLSEPIRFTPADPIHSRRQYPFGDKNTFKPKGQYRHEPGCLAVVVGLAVRNGGVWEKQRVRLHYSAPRFLRDGLRSDSEELTKMPWLQPMMEALGIETACPQDLHNVPVFLMPSRGRKGEVMVHLNFPVTLDEANIVSALGQRERWNRQFAGGKDKNIYLLWPNDTGPNGWKDSAWHLDPKPFRLLSVDLGTRDAGAAAIIECRPDEKFDPRPDGRGRHCRFIGEAGGRRWHAAVLKTGMLRLPGEDAMVWRNGQLCQEYSGEKGRLASVAETKEAAGVVMALGYPDLLDNSPEDSRFFARQNQKLLLALRWSQKRLASWQSWSWMLGTDAKREQAQAGLATDEALPDELKKWMADDKWPLVGERLNTEIEQLKELLSRQLVQIASRVVPLRGRNWEWVKRWDEPGYVLRQTERGSDPSKTKIAGQRGLSMERIEQIEDLRKRCQSLNKALQHSPGEKPVLGFRTKGRAAADPCPDLLEKLDHLREQRVNQTAHLILAEALGVQLRPHRKTKVERTAKDIHGEYEKVREPVDFIVLEDLNRYLTSQGRSKTENSRLMKWCHRALLIKLKQLCETYGIPVLETAAAYSSRFSAKDGVPGFRAKEVSLADKNRFPWKRMLEQGDADATRLFTLLEEISSGQSPERPRKLLAPVAGGPIFVPMLGNETQADINAAINLGLRAVAAPDVLEIHHKIRTEKTGDSTLTSLVRSNREKARWGDKPASFEFGSGVKLDRNSNCFPLSGFAADYEGCSVEGRAFATGKGLWGTVKSRQWERVQELNKARVLRWQKSGVLPPEDDLRY